ncbi:MAG TPA: radical SAM protein [bacterium]|nr:radical SAM protein [bacterium]
MMNIVPLYLPHQGCTHQCVYCNQPLTVGTREDESDWEHRLEAAFSRSRPGEWEIALYGGSFSALDQSTMERCFARIHPYTRRTGVRGVRISTRPDCVSDSTLDFLSENGVRTIELGVESLDDTVLRHSGRCHTARDAAEACARIQRHGFTLGIHLMCGLPGQTESSWRETVDQAAGLRPDLVRIAPTLVLRDTPLEQLFRRGAYTPLSLEEAIEQCGYGYQVFHRQGIAIARVGLALSDSRGDGADKVVAGPWHPALRHEVESRLAGRAIETVLGQTGARTLIVNPRDLSIVQGPRRANLTAWRGRLNAEVQIHPDERIVRHTFTVPAGGWYSLFLDGSPIQERPS